MKPHRKKRLYGIIAIVLGVGLATALAIYALGQNMNAYLTPSQVLAKSNNHNHVFRLGGIVKKGSFKRAPDSLAVSFVLTDHQDEIPVQYIGILPALFREEQGIIVQGKLNADGKLIADQVLAKHDENYMPPGISGQSSKLSELDT